MPVLCLIFLQLRMCLPVQNIDLRTQLSSLQLELQEALQTRDIAVADQAEAKQVLKEQVMLASGVSVHCHGR